MFRVRPWWLAWVGRGRWVTVYHHIYHPKDVRPELWPDVVAHELVHLAQQKGRLVRWLVRYALSRAFRLRQEAEGVAAEVAAVGPLNAEWVRRFYARELAGFPYLWAASSRQAAREAILRAESRASSGCCAG